MRKDMVKECAVYDRVIKFMMDNDIRDGETVYQSDRVSENSLEFIDELLDIVKDELPEIIDDEW